MKRDTVYLDPLPEEEVKNGKIFAIMGGKGGTSKTTTAFNTSLYLVRAGKSCLAIDMDPQCNLTQRSGIPDGDFEENRLSELFVSMRSPVFVAQRKRLPILIKLPYLFKLPESDKKVGKLAILPGSPNALLDARSAYGKSIDSKGHPRMYELFKETLEEYKKHYGNIVMDLGPNLNGNELAMLAARTADVIVCPIDSIYAAYGVKLLIQFIGEQAQLRDDGKYPKIVFIMTKYHVNLKAESDEDEIPIENSVYVAIKKVFGYNVCDNGVEESKKLREETFGRLGKNNEYIAPMNEIIEKLKAGIPNIFDYWGNDTINLLDKELRVIEEKAKAKRQPEFIRSIVYNTKPRADYGSRKQTDLKEYFVQDEEFTSSGEDEEEEEKEEWKEELNASDGDILDSILKPEDIYNSLEGNAAAFSIRTGKIKRKYTRKEKV